MPIITDPNGIRLYQFAACVGRLKLESRGIRFKGPSLFNRFKRDWGYKGKIADVVMMAEQDKLAGREGRLQDVHSPAYRALLEKFNGA